VRIALCVVASLIAQGCTTLTYTSQRQAADVSECIAAGWRGVASSGVEIPVSLTKENDYYYIDVVPVRDFPTFLPIHSIWAKVRPKGPQEGAGSSTEYRSNFQITHERIDRVVKECQ
jgi:hypothetical protein